MTPEDLYNYIMKQAEENPEEWNKLIEYELTDEQKKIKTRGDSIVKAIFNKK